MKKVLIHIIVLIIVFGNVNFSQQAVVKVLPYETNIELFSTTEILVSVENINLFRAYSINLSYDPQKIRCLSITRLTFFSNWNTFFYQRADSNSSLMVIEEAILGLGYENGSGELFKIQFQALALGDVNINFLKADLRDTLNNPIPVQSENGVLHIVNPTLVDDVGEYINNNSITAFPNPINSSTRIEFNSNSFEDTEFAIYSITGERVYLLESKPQSGNTISFIWNGESNDGNLLPSGVYLLLAKNKNALKTFKLIMLK